jgi:bifunctional DNA-binding transcriptional regulator/antitoxin component of YhaV-PrlF toxin-antitoxin module
MNAEPTDRRRTRKYRRRRSGLTEAERLELDLVEERILSERAHPFRHSLADGQVLDLSAYRDTGIAVTYRPSPDGNHLFVDFVIAR